MGRLRRVGVKYAAMTTCMYAEGNVSPRSKNRRLLLRPEWLSFCKDFPETTLLRFRTALTYIS